MIRDKELAEVAEKSYSVSDVMKRLGLVPMGGNHKCYKRRLKELGVKFAKRPPRVNSQPRALDEYLILNGPGIGSSNLRIKLIKAGIKKKKCEECGQGPTWNNKPLRFHLDHIDGNKRNNKLENLRILCPNCHCQTPTYAIIKEESRAKKKSKTAKKRLSGRKCTCGKLIQNRNKTGLCRKCYVQKFPPPRKVSSRPSTDILLAEIDKLGYKGVGRKYGVSDNSVRKWVAYE